ncbi:MAG: OmpA family protein [Bacteroidota bacterium]|nr:OmpA family protein [Bacteroidota bacterium]
MRYTIRFSTLSIFLAMSILQAFAQNETPTSRSIITPKRYDVTVTNPGRGINSPDDDFAPLVLANGRVIYFTTDRDGDQNIYSAVSGGAAWGKPVNVGPTLNTNENDGGASLTPDGHWIVYTGCDREDGVGDCDIYLAEYGGGTWRNARNLTPVNSAGWDSQPSISADATMLFFASDRPGGMGGTDIWMSRRVGDDWSPPVNLGPPVNTSGDEMTPFIAPDNRTLYFASNGHPGVGGFDIYVARIDHKGMTGSVEHIGSPINTAGDELFFTTQLGTDNVYFASTSSDFGNIGGLDIYAAVPNPIPPSAVTAVFGIVSDAKTKAPLGATLTIRNIMKNEVISTFHSDDIDGTYVVVLQPGMSYAMTAEAPGYLFYSERFDIPANAANNTVRKDILMTRELVRLLVFFDFDKATLQPESYVDLERAVSWLKTHPDVRVEVAGHTDNVGSREYNKHLSSERARTVMDYLISKGVAPSRLTANGYGPDQPIATNDTEEGRAMNRRVEFRVK